MLSSLLQMSLLMYQQEEYLHARAFMQRYLASNRATPEALYLAVQIEKGIASTEETATVAEWNRKARYHGEPAG